MSYRATGGFSFGGSLSTMIRLLIAWTVIVFLVQQLADRFVTGLGVSIVYTLGLIPADVWHGQVWRLATYMFLHGGLLHIAFNMLFLWMFGSDLERLWGPRRFLKYYFITGIGAGLTNAIVTPGSTIPIVGASGAVYGLLLAYAHYFPNRTILLWFLIPIRVKYFVIILGALNFFASIGATGDGIAHWAHLGGLLFGYLYLKNIPMRWFRGGGRRGGGGRGGGTKIYDIRKYRDPDDNDPKWR